MITDFIRRLLLPLALGAAALSASCTRDTTGEPDGPTPGGGDQISFEIGFAPETRVSTGADFRSTWEEGDQIGIFATLHGQPLVAQDNYIHHARLTYTDGVWKFDAGAELWWPVGSGKLDFYAYYPYKDDIIFPMGVDPTDLSFSVHLDQNGVAFGKSLYNLSDLLKATANNNGAGYGHGDGAVALQFSHVLALVQIEIGGQEVNVPPLDDNLAVTLPSVQRETVLNWTGESSAREGPPFYITMHKVEGLEHTYRALVPAQTLASDFEVAFTQTTPGSEIDMQYHGLVSARLTGGKVTKHKVTLGWGVDPDHKYKVGDAYPNAGPAIGVVCWLDTAHPDYDAATQSGTYGRVISLDEGTGLKWGPGIDEYPAVEGIRSQTDGYTATRNLIALRSGSGTFAADYPAFGWIWRKNGSQPGEWYMPAQNELKQIWTDWSGRMTEFSNFLTAAGGEPLLTGQNEYYWLSSEDAGLPGGCRILRSSEGAVATSAKGNVRSLRAFHKFGTPSINTPPAPLPDGYYTAGDYWPDRNVTFSAPGVVRKGTAPQGIVCRIDPASSSDGGATGNAGNIISLDEGDWLRWGPDHTDESATAPNIRSETDGYTATRELIAARNDSAIFTTYYQAFHWIWLKNGSQQGEWYIPAVKEFRGFFTNATAINASLATAGGTPIGNAGQYWSSTEADLRLVRDPISDIVTNFKTGAKLVRAAKKF